MERTVDLSDGLILRGQFRVDKWCDEVVEILGSRWSVAAGQTLYDARLLSGQEVERTYNQFGPPLTEMEVIAWASI